MKRPEVGTTVYLKDSLDDWVIVNIIESGGDYFEILVKNKREEYHKVIDPNINEYFISSPKTREAMTELRVYDKQSSTIKSELYSVWAEYLRE